MIQLLFLITYQTLPNRQIIFYSVLIVKIFQIRGISGFHLNGNEANNEVTKPSQV